MPSFEKDHLGGPGRQRGSRKMIDEACGGDRVASRLVLNCIWSAPKGRPLQVELPEIRTPNDLLAAHGAVAAALA